MKKNQQTEKNPTQQHKQFLAALLIGYLCIVLLFPVLMGEQLYFRPSRDNLMMPDATAGTGELLAGDVVEQHFTANIQRLETIQIHLGTFNRNNLGNASVELIREDNGTVLLSQSLNAEEIPNGFLSELTAETPLEGLAGVPLVIRLTSADGAVGSALCPMINGEESIATRSLTVNGETTPGTLCFSATGEDYIWTGLHYWKFVLLGGLLLSLLCALSFYRVRQGKPDPLFKMVVVIQKYRFLIRQLVNRDFKTKYKRSVLGVLWSFLNPLLTMLVQYLVFSSLFRFDVPYYPLYLLAGVTLFNFFSESTSMTLSSIVGNASLITKVYMPKYIYPVTRTLSSLVNLLLAIIPLLVVMLLSGLYPTKAIFLLPFPLICLMVFSLGIGLILASSMVFFRDTQFLWGVLTMIWMYLTPLFYPASILPQSVAWVLKCNPLYYFVTFVRTLLMEGISPEPLMYVQCAAFAFGALLIGGLIFKKSQDKFVLYL